MAKKLKDIIKQNPEPARGKVGVNPSDPWSAKANIAESASLNQYLLSRGINPQFVSKETKISHAKSSAFLKWKQNHQFEEIQLEEVDKEDTLTFDIPLMIRMLELAREDVKDDMELHRITERLISIRNKGILTMDDYEFIAGIKKLKEEIETMAEGRMKDIATDKAENKRLNKLTTLQKFRADSAAREKKHSDIEKSSGGMTSAIDRLEKHLNKEEVVTEMDKTQTPPGRDNDGPFQGPDKTVKPVTSNKAKKDTLKLLNKNFNKEDVFQDPQAATQTVFDGGNNTDDCSCDRKSQMSKSARMIKALYKKHNMKEEMYDWEKDDKNQISSGKKAKLTKADDSSNFTQSKPEARAVLSGGKTMTGEKRDTIEIDPLLKNRPDLNGTKKDEVSKKINKINN